MNIKFFEIRDVMTTIFTYAVQLQGRNSAEMWMLRRHGYSPNGKTIILTRLCDGKSENDVYEWTNRTMAEAHKYIEENFDSLKSGDVVDVEFILGLSKVPKVSERLEDNI